MGRRTLIELLRMVLAVIATGTIANLAAWSVPNARGSIWAVAWAAAAVVIFMGLRPLKAAWDADRGIDKTTADE